MRCLDEGAASPAHERRAGPQDVHEEQADLQLEDDRLACGVASYALCHLPVRDPCGLIEAEFFALHDQQEGAFRVRQARCHEL